MRDHPESLKAKNACLEELLKINSKALDFYSQKVAIWEGKFHAVKRENNALRKKLYQTNL